MADTSHVHLDGAFAALGAANLRLHFQQNGLTILALVNWLTNRSRITRLKGGFLLPPSPSSRIGGRLALDFANDLGPAPDFSWEELLRFLLTSRIISPERSAQLLSLPDFDPQTASRLLTTARRLEDSLQVCFAAMVDHESFSPSAVQPINDVLRVTEGHDELAWQDPQWRLQFVAREDTLEWLLAAVARSAAEIIAEGSSAPLRICSNPACGLFFYDTSRTHRRRWCSMARCGNRHKVATFLRRHSRRER